MRLLVVSRSPMMAMTLRAEGFDVSDLRPPRFSEWLNAGSDEVDALVLDLADPRVALQAVIELRARARMAPALLVSGEDDGWDDLAVRDLPAAQVLPLPVTRPALLSALSELLSGHGPEVSEIDELPEQSAGTAAQSDTPQPDAPPEDEQTPRADGAIQPTEQLQLNTAPAFPADASAVAAVAIALAPVPEFRPSLAPPERHPSTLTAQQNMTPSADLVAAELPTESGEAAPNSDTVAGQPGPPEVAEPSETVPQPSAPVVPVPPPTATRATGFDAPRLVRMLQEQVSDLVSVVEVADVVIADAVDRVRAQAGALLVPDGARWRVSGSVGLRALEHRLELDESSWLVTEVAQGGKGIIVEDSDIARNPLKGAPLASWRHLLAAPIALVEAILLLARSDTPFEESDLADLVTLSKEAGPLLQGAMETRALARSLGDFADLES